MAGYQTLVCDDQARRAQIAAHKTLNGIDYLEVVTAPPADDERVLKIYFIAKDPGNVEGQKSLSDMLKALDGAPGKITVQGGVRVPHIGVLTVIHKDDHLETRVSEPGDYSTYTLVINHPALDPAFAQVDFSFKAGCPTHFDCLPRVICPPVPRFQPLIDYMAKDYASFRRALIDLIPSLMPGWAERHEADLGMALVDLLAYAGDHLSYYQDAIATETFFETARQRISVRRHAHLIDYRMHDGASARAFLRLQLKDGTSGTLPGGTEVLSRINVPLRGLASGPELPPHSAVLAPELRESALTAASVVFETMADANVHAGLNLIKIHAWGNRQCCLLRGVTTVDLVGDLAADLTVDPPTTWKLKRGDFLLFEEVKGVATGLPADADRTHRQVVRLLTVEKNQDPVEPDATGTAPLALTRVTWDPVDALAFPLCLSLKLVDGTYVDDVSVARGNLVLCDHGQTITEWFPGDPVDPRVPGIETGERAYRFLLREGPLSFRAEVKDNGRPTPVHDLATVDPHKAAPQVILDVSTDGSLDRWSAAPDLLESRPLDTHFVVEPENDGRALIRFGDDEYGMAPPNGAHIHATYRIGVGTRGNIGANALAHVIQPRLPPLNWPQITDLTNPLPAWGGIDAQPLDQVKLVAPAAFHAELFRAVTEADYAAAVEKLPEVAKAVATLRWTGSWYTVFVTIDPRGRKDVAPELQDRIRAWVAGYTQTGYDLEINAPIYVPLDIAIDVCVDPYHFRSDVEQAVLAALSDRILPDGRRGFFHPDNFTFHQPLYLSQLYAAVRAVEGVDSAVVTRFQRFGKLANHELEQGYIPIGRLEVARLSNDPNFPENGVLRLTMGGGK